MSQAAAAEGEGLQGRGLNGGQGLDDGVSTRLSLLPRLLDSSCEL